MIRPVNMSIRNNNTQNNVNFKAKGSITNKVMHTVHPGVIANLQKLPPAGRTCDGAIYEALGTNHFNALYAGKRVDLDLLNREHSRLFRHDGSVPPTEEQLRKLLIENKFTDEAGVFVALPPKSLTIGYGKDTIPDEFPTTNVTLIGGEFDKLVYAQNITVQGVRDPLLNIQAINRVEVTNSTIGDCEGDWVQMNGSTAKHVTAGEDADFAGRTTVNGNVFAKESAYYSQGSHVVHGNVNTGTIGTTEGSRVLIKGCVGEDQPVKSADVNGTLVTAKLNAAEVHIADTGHLLAGTLFADRAKCYKGGSIDAANWVVKSSKMPLGERLRRWLTSSGKTQDQIRLILDLA